MLAGRDAEKDLTMCEAATDGQWHTQPDGQYSLAIVSLPEQEVICFTDNFGVGVHDGQFIAEARTALPHWIQRALDAEEKLKWVSRDTSEMHDDWIESSARASAAVSEINQLVEALKWYADEKTYNIPHIGCTSKVMADRGKRARDTLEELGIEVSK